MSTLHSTHLLYEDLRKKLAIAVEALERISVSPLAGNRSFIVADTLEKIGELK